MSDESLPRPRFGWLGIVLNIFLCLGILAASAAGIWLIYRTEPTATQIETKRKSAALVETIVVKRATYSPRLVVLGTVQPAQDIVLSPRVSGQVLNMSPSFVPGGMVKKGEVLLEIDPADFENALSIRTSELEQVQADWEIEIGRQKLAEQELKLLGDSIDEINRALVLREPQAASLKSQLNAAKAAVRRAELDLERTKVTAPFDAQILRRSVNLGSQVGPGDDLGQLVGIEEYWVNATVPVRNLRWVQFPEDGKQGSKVELYNPDAWGASTFRTGYVSRMIGALDQRSRLARLLVTVEDPLGQKNDAPPLILDALMEAQIQGIKIDNVVRLDREYVRNDDTVWVMSDGKLEIRKIEIAFEDPEFAYITDGLNDGDEVVITTLATVAEGVLLRRVDEDAPANGDSESRSDADSEDNSGSKQTNASDATSSELDEPGPAGEPAEPSQQVEASK